MSTKQLTARVKLNTTDVESKLSTLERRIKRIQNTLNGTDKKSGIDAKVEKAAIRSEKLNQAMAKTAYQQQRVKTEAERTAYQQQRVQTEVAKTELTQQRVNREQRKTKTQQEQIKNAVTEWNNRLNKSKSIFSSIGDMIKRIARTVIGIGTIKIAIQGADELTGAENRLNNIAGMVLGDSAYEFDGNGVRTAYSNAAHQFTEDAMDKIYVAAKNSRSNYVEMMSNVSKTMTLAPTAFQNNVDNAIRFQEIMAKAYTIGGATAQEMSGSMYQLTQALGAGILAGDELRSVREGAPLAYQAIEEFAQGVLNSEKSLKDLASQGKITSDIVVAAIMNMGEETDQIFALTKYRFSEVWNQIKSAGQRAFQPVVQMLTDMLNKAVDNGLIEKAENLMLNAAKAAMVAMKYVEKFATTVAENWKLVAGIVVGAIMLMITWTVVKSAISVAAAYIELEAHLTAAGLTLKAWLQANAGMLACVGVVAVVALAVMALAGVFILWKTGALDTCQAIIAAVLIVGVAVTIIMAIITGGITLIPLLIAAGIALIVKFLEYFLAIVYSIGAAIWNTCVGIMEGLIQAMWTIFVEPFIGIIEWILNACNGGFNGVLGGIANFAGQVISIFLSLGKVVTKIIDAIAGTNWSAELSALQSKVLSWGKKNDAITLDREILAGSSAISYKNAWNTGMAHGNAVKNYVPSGGGLNNLAGKLGLNLSDAFGENMFPSADDPAYSVAGAYDPSGIGKSVKNIDGNTGKMADAMDLTKEDLEQLRKIAEMEWKKEYTTANVTINMDNQNTINNQGDLDGWVISLRDMLEEEISMVANGVYA